MKIINNVIKGSGDYFRKITPEEREVTIAKLITIIPQLDTQNVTDMSSMFQGCAALTTIPQLDTQNVTDMSYMFQGCAALTTIPQLDTQNVMLMSYMFQGCAALTTIPQLDTQNVKYMDSMFQGCAALTTIPQLDTQNVRYMDSMFQGCAALEFVNIVNWTISDISLSDSPKLTPLSVHNIISQAKGPENKTLTLHPDSKAAWEASEYYLADSTNAVSKNITILEATPEE